MTNESRRQFLSSAARLAAGGSALSLCRHLGLVDALAQSSSCSGYKALVCIYFAGGNDGTNMVLPVSGTQSFAGYARIRGAVALAEAQVQQIQAAGGKSVYGLHPRLSGLRKLYETGKLAVLCNVGTLAAPITRAQYLQASVAVPSNLFSHSDQQAEWQTSTTTSQTATGWGGRLADRMAACGGTGTFPTVLSMAGNAIFGNGQRTRIGTIVPGTTTGLQGFGTPPNPRYTAFQQLLQVDNGLNLVQAANNIAASGVSDSETVNAALAATSKLTTAFPTTTLGAQLRTVARLIEQRQLLGVQRQIFFCSLGGFDTHQNELTAQDALMLQVGPALAALYTATEELGIASEVTSFTASEFGRTVQPNGNSGADHGWGSHHFVLGGAVRGGDVYGQYPSLELGGADDANTRGVFIPTTATDQYHATLAAWFGVATADLPQLFPNLGNFSTPVLQFL
jgi:uncharacterized protein (DUF1501 family)